MLPLVYYPNQILRQKTHKISPLNNSDLDILINEMKESMITHEGIGLAAPQVGKELNLFVATGDGKNIETFINPKIIKRFGKVVDFEEGCLSIPGVYGVVSRPEKILITYRDANKKIRLRAFDGLWSRVVQHEYDHLFGILFTDLSKKITKGDDLFEQYGQKQL
jgi:peptide deformylase